MQLVYKSMSMAGSVAAVPRGNTAKIMSHIIIAKLVHFLNVLKAPKKNEK